MFQTKLFIKPTKPLKINLNYVFCHLLKKKFLNEIICGLWLSCREGFGWWVQGVVSGDADPHGCSACLIMLGLCAAREEGGWKTAQAEETNDKL